MSGSEIMHPELAAEKALTATLTKNLPEMYAKGVSDGVIGIITQTSDNLEKVSKAPECPEDLRAGFLEASLYLKSIISGQPYQLKGKPTAPQRSKRSTKLEMVAKAKAAAVAKKLDNDVNPEHRQ